jgi:hypothetical protein
MKFTEATLEQAFVELLGNGGFQEMELHAVVFPGTIKRGCLTI